MHQNGLLTALKCGNDAHVSAVLASVDSSTWPCETLLPFVLRKTLRNLPEDMELGYVEQCLRYVSNPFRICARVELVCCVTGVRVFRNWLVFLCFNHWTNAIIQLKSLYGGGGGCATHFTAIERSRVNLDKNS